MSIVALDHVQVAAPAGCEQDARWFFGELLGLSEIEKPEALRPRGGVWFAVGAQQLHVGVAQRFTPAVKAHPALGVIATELDALAAKLLAAGIEITWDETIPGTRRLHTEDPWGNRLELIAVSSSGATRA